MIDSNEPCEIVEDEYQDEAEEGTCGNGPIFCGYCWRCQLEDDGI